MNTTLNSNFTVVTPPSLFVPTKGIKIFLGGSIDLGKSNNWQQSIINHIKNTWVEDDITIYNPRRDKNFDISLESEQAAWSISMLNISDYILLYLTGPGPSPIATLELGLFINNPKLYLSINDSYSRKEIIEYHYNCFGIRQIFNTPEECINNMKLNWYRKNLK